MYFFLKITVWRRECISQRRKSRWFYKPFGLTWVTGIYRYHQYLRPHGAQYSKQVRIPNTSRWDGDQNDRHVIGRHGSAQGFQHPDLRQKYTSLFLPRKCLSHNLDLFQIYKCVIIRSYFSIYISQYWCFIWAYILQRLKSKGWSL